MFKYKLTIEYDGSSFQGWQIQPEGFGVTVQGELKRALFKFTGEDYLPVAAGRTDAGVHARGMVAHIALNRDWRTDKIRDAYNAWLRPHAISILKVERVSDEFDARFTCLKRHYTYKIINRRAPLALDKGLAWWIPRDLNVEKMQQAATHLLGHHDFSTFRASECQAKTPMRTLAHLEVVREGEHIFIHTNARSYLHHMVRSISGSLMEVGIGAREPIWMQDILKAADRTQCGEVAPACGLYFMGADYESAP